MNGQSVGGLQQSLLFFLYDMKEDDSLVLVWSDVIHCHGIHPTRIARIP